MDLGAAHMQGLAAAAPFAALGVWQLALADIAVAVGGQGALDPCAFGVVDAQAQVGLGHVGLHLPLGLVWISA